MTEQEWLASTDPDKMAVYLHCDHEEYRRRKNRLLACACLRRIWHLLTDERCRRAIEFEEHDADDESLVDDSRSIEHENRFREAHNGASDAWGAMAEAADAGNYATPILRAMPDAGLAAYHAIDGDLQCVGNASDAVASFAAPNEDPAWDAAKEQEAGE